MESEQGYIRNKRRVYSFGYCADITQSKGIGFAECQH